MTAETRIFLHQTKTAGGTLKTALRNCDGLNVEFLYGPEDRQRLAEADLSEVDLVYGHSIFGVHEDLGLAPRYMCFLRHPVMRTISHYYHLRNVDKGPVGNKIRESKDINDFFRASEHWEFSNFLSKTISGIGRGEVPEGTTLFKAAVKNVDEHFEFMGFQEFFPLSVLKLGDLLGVRIRLAKDINMGTYRLGDVSPRTIRKIERMNRIDLRLYAYCLKKFI